MKIAVMQPYLFPYIGYFQLIKEVDLFVFYDDVNFIKRGWINRNRLLQNSEAKLFSVPLVKASQNKLINEVELGFDEKWKNQFFMTLKHNYSKAPYYENVMALVEDVFSENIKTISDLAILSILRSCSYLGLNIRYELSSVAFSETKGMDKADRLIEICKKSNGTEYINPAGGLELYNKEYFEAREVKLSFIENEIVPYRQFENDFIGGLSFLDVLMFNSREQVIELLNFYKIK